MSPAPGRFGQALDTRVSPVAAPGKKGYRRPPLTAELHAQLFSKANYNILLANETKGSPTHWEIFSMPGSGHFTAYLPGHQPDHVHSTIDIADGKWHHLGFVYEPERIRLFVDGKLAADQKVTPRNSQTTQEELMIGSLVERGIESQGLIDDVRISKGARDLSSVPTAAAKPDDNTLSLWSFDTEDKGKFPDTGSLKNAARPAGNAPIPAAQRQGPVPPDGSNATPVDPSLQVKLISRSEEDAYMGVKVDRAGQIFVGARDALFKFRPDGQGGFLPREEIYRFPKDSLIMGLEYLGDDLYVLTANALYLLPGARTRTTDIKPKRLIWGLPLDLHISFHCLAWGPEGDLYLNHGDPLLNYGDYDRADHWGHWTYFCQPEGTRVPYTGVGAVLRCKPDGSQLRVVATGLRGPVGLAFDPHWNLFTNENDHESRADLYAPAKLMHVTPHIDFGWPRGWIASKTPNRHDLIEPMIATLGRGVPCDLVYYGESLLPEKYRGAPPHGPLGPQHHSSLSLPAPRQRFPDHRATLCSRGKSRPPRRPLHTQTGHLFIANTSTSNVWSPTAAATSG
ncbi:MAG: LamG-like jellyroll fold domain-containing protein [Planctomycetales bacterium]